MSKEILLVVPTRSRPQSSIDFYESFVDNSSITDLMFGLDNDDHENYPRIDGVLYEVNDRMWVNGTMNYISNKYVDEYKYIAFMGDDHRIRTLGWDTELLSSIHDVEYGVAYGNDLFQGPNLATAVLMDTKIIKKLGYMAPPTLRHLYIDNFWMDIGNALGTLRYSNDVILEHMHYLNGKSIEDDGYREVNSQAFYQADSSAYSEYLNTKFQDDVKKILEN